jgi:hypothetical protein
MANQRQTRRPVLASYALTRPRVGNSPPAVPTITVPPASNGAAVKP